MTSLNRRPGLLILVVASIVVLANVVDGGNNADILHKRKSNIQLSLYDGAIRLLGTGATDVITFKVYAMNYNKNKGGRKNVLYSTLMVDHSKFRAQPKKGILYLPNTMITISANVSKVNETDFLFKIFRNGRQEATGNLIPFKNWEGVGFKNITLLNHRFERVGNVQIQYAVIRPITTFEANWPSYCNITGNFFVGHRGTGIGRRMDTPEKQYLENTLDSFNFACSAGAEMVELDVQLTSDKVPIIDHDFAVIPYIHEFTDDVTLTMFTFNNNLPTHAQRGNPEGKIPKSIQLKDLSFDEIERVQTQFTTPEDKDNQPFMKLEKVLNELDPKCGIDVEVKYPQMDIYNRWPGEPGLEMNEYIDIILKTLYEHGHDRKIFISSFHPDLCSMVQLKQNRFPVALVSSGKNKYWPPEKDPRNQKFETGLAFVQSMNLNGGLSLLVDNVKERPNIIAVMKDHQVPLYLWGSDLANYTECMEYQNKGVSGVIVDKIDVLLKTLNQN